MYKILFISLISISLSDIWADESRVIDVAFNNCKPMEEVCGNGVDDDCNGVDEGCGGSDNDNDGFNDNVDCDPNNHFIYPGQSVTCSSECGEGIKTCNNSGDFNSCNCSPLCEAKGSGKCYYVDPINGNDNNSGNFQSRLKTLKRFGSYYNGTPSPANKINLLAGDVVYMFSGVYSDAYLSDSNRQIIRLAGIRGTSSAPIVLKSYPGQVPVISPSTSSRGIYILSSSYLQFNGFQIKGATDAGLAAFDSDNIKISNLKVYDTAGWDNENIAGLYMVNVKHLEVSNSVIFDNYDRECLDTQGQKTENSRNMVLFGGGSVKIHHNYIFHTQAKTATKTGGCLVYKHSQTLSGGLFEVHNNTFRNCYFTAIGNGGYGGRFKHNLIIDSDAAIMIKDMGGGANGQDNLAEYNTILRGEAFIFNPSMFIDFGYPIGKFDFKNNIVSDNRTYNYDAGGIASVDIYGSNSVYDQTVSAKYLTTSNNCYYSSKDNVGFAFYSSNSNPASSKGDLYSLSSWQTLGFDVGSIEEDPNLSPITFKPQTAACSDMGY